MSKYIGSKLDDFLDEEGLLAEAEAVAAKRVIAFQLRELGIMAEDFTDVVLHARFRKLDAVVKIKNGKCNIDIKGARKNFNNYNPLNQ